MGAFEIDVKVQDKVVTIFVIPFEIPDETNSAGYLLVLNDVTLGSIKMGDDNRWVTEDELPWTGEDLQLIGDCIGYQYLLSVF